MARGKKKTPNHGKSKTEDIAHTTEQLKGKKENKPEMNGDIFYNGQSSIRPFLSPSKPRSPLHDENSIAHIHDGKSPGKRTVQQGSTKKEEEKQNGINPEVSITKSEESEAKRLESSGTESLPKYLELEAARLHSSADMTPENNGADRSSPKTETRRKVKVKSHRTADSKNSQNRKVTDYFPIRRSSRKSKTELKCEEKKQIDELIKSGIEEGMKVQHIEGKGRGVFATTCFRKGQFVVEYHGDLLQMTDAKKREAEYAQDPSTGCYMYYFQYLSKTYCVDATKETSRFGRLINHSKNGNCQTKLHDINGIPHLILVASRDIDEGEELLYDYGDRSKASIAAHPWLKH
uniref:[histone H4]-lysine(20) N-methyltransferase n=1 Tax=Lepisosteus oculatus TaxID=7918 RepID=W5MEX4_LEPOC|nr:PREDICTED: N-lysine methyltransferase SETD8 [Lepisosteus oculatus]